MWRFTFQESSAFNDHTIFLFTLSVNEEANCFPVAYRPGDCCRQALDAISLALAPNQVGLVKYVKMYTYDGKDISVQFVQSESTGLKIELPSVTYTTDLPAGKFNTFEIGFNSGDWADTTKFPCKQSAYEPSLPSCDYWVHGFQTQPGNPSVMITPDESTAGCCPEGVVSFCSERITGTCNPRLGDSPFRLKYLNTTQLLRTTTVTFAVSSQSVVNPIGPSEGLPDCSNMQLASFKLYLSDFAASKFATISHNSQTATATVKKDAAGSYVEATVPAGRSGVGNWVLTLNERLSNTDVCGYALGQYSVCNFVFNGRAGSCCSMGDVAVATIDRVKVQFG